MSQLLRRHSRRPSQHHRASTHCAAASNICLPERLSFAAICRRRSIACETAERLTAADDPTRTDIETLAGQVYARLGRWDAGDSALQTALLRADGAHDHYRRALALNNLGMARYVRNRWDEALPFFQNVLALDDIVQATVYASALIDAGMCYSRLGQFDRAIPLQQHAVALNAKRPVL